MKNNNLHIHVEITYDCNNRCFYCYNEEHKPIHMTLEQSNIFANKLEQYIYSRNFSVSISLTGGEPFKNFDVLTNLYYKITRFPSCNVSINTNLTCEIKKLKDLENLKKETEIELFVSIPSMIKEIYNDITCSKNYDLFFESLQYVLSKPDIYNISSNIVINKKNKNTILKSLMQMNLLGLKNFKITNLISEKVDNELLDIIFNIIKYSKKFGMDFRGMSMPLIVDNKEKRSLLYQQYIKEYNFNTCSAGDTSFAITPDGYLKPCPSLSNDIKYFNIFNSNEFIPDILRNNRYSLACTKCELCNHI